jgi:hypothetical protein
MEAGELVVGEQRLLQSISWRRSLQGNSHLHRLGTDNITLSAAGYIRPAV